VVSKINGLTDNVTLNGGHNVDIVQFGHILTFNATSAGADDDWNVDGENLYPAVSGNVGIGTATPAAKLHVGSSGNTELRIDSDDIEGMLSFYGSLNGASRDAYLQWDSDNSKLNLSANGSTPQLTVTRTNHYVGIGTELPLGRLHVETFDLGLAASNLSGDEIVVEAMDAVLGLYSYPIGTTGSGITLGEAHTGYLHNKWSILRQATTGGGGLRFDYGTDPDPELGETVLYLSNDGKVGIGTTEPSAALEVVGGVRMSGGLEKAGAILKSSSNGTGSWSYITADYEVSPTKAFESDGTNDLIFIYDGAFVEIQTTGFGESYSDVTIPVDIPSRVMGTLNYVEGLEVRYRVNDPADDIHGVELICAASEGTNETLVSNTSILDNTNWSALTIAVSPAEAIHGALVVRLHLHFSGGGSAHYIQLGTITVETVN
jgi:hypothetical protein